MNDTLRRVLRTDLFNPPRHLVLFTCHRREASEEQVRGIFKAVAKIAARPDVLVLYPVHPNRISAIARETLSDAAGVVMMPPVDFIEMQDIYEQATLAITDSGGVQEEAPCFGCRTLVVREVTERPEWIYEGMSELVGFNEGLIVNRANAILDNERRLLRMRQSVVRERNDPEALPVVCTVDHLTCAGGGCTCKERIRTEPKFAERYNLPDHTVQWLLA